MPKLARLVVLCVFAVVCSITPIFAHAQVAADSSADATSKRVCPLPSGHTMECTARLLLHVTESTPKASGVVKFPTDAKVYGVKPDVAPTAPSGYGPADLQSAYNLAAASAANGAGVTIAIVDAYDDPDAESNLAEYRSTFGLPACTTANGCFSKVNQSGQTSPLPGVDVGGEGGWELEESLDLDMASAICPKCNILLIEANSSSDANLYAAVNEAAALGANVISNSYGNDEYSGEQTDTCPNYAQAGIAVVVASGDSGYGVNEPAACPTVTAAGGTSLVTASNARGWSETVWNSDDGGPGSGCSAYEPKPSYQTDPDCANRTLTDMSADADPNTGAAVYDSYPYYGYTFGWVVVGGTSEASPIIGGVYALSAPPPATVYPVSYAYANTGDFYDVTSGTNVVSGGPNCGGTYLCVAEVGYDGPTGWGTPNGIGGFGPPVQITVGTTPSGLSFSVDGTSYSSTQTFSWVAGSSHTLLTTSSQTPSTGTQDAWSSWSDSGTISHSVNTPLTATTYTATFNTSYLLTTAANPPSEGSVNPPSGTYYASGAVVPLAATANPGYVFSSWSGSVASAGSASTTVTMSAPQSVTANFVAIPPQVSASPSSVAFGGVEECPIKKTGEQTITLIDNGATLVQIGPLSLINVTGNPSDFSARLECAGILGPKKGHSCTIAVKFSPSALISEGETLNIVTNAPGSPVQVPITGTGTAGSKCK